MKRYILAIDQSTQGTKGLLFDEAGDLVGRADRAHRQIISEEGWVSHDPEEIRANVLAVCRDVTERAGIDRKAIAAVGISNQRETTVAWNRETGESICDAVVWQCARAEEICARHAGMAETVREKTGLNLSPYFPCAKMAWILEHVPATRELAAAGELAFGTVDSWLISFLSADHGHRTDYSNAGRTQLFNLRTLTWDAEICEAFGIPMSSLPEVCMSDACFGMTDLGGFLDSPVPIRGVLGDSHGALFGQNCRRPGQVKATYGTGSSVMMHIGDAPRFSENGLVTSLAWGLNGKVSYVFEGNLNYTGAVIAWLKNDAGLIETEEEATSLALSANPLDRTYFVPAFSGLGAPYWDSRATGTLTGITRTTGRAEIAKACLDCIAYQIADLVRLMGQDAGLCLETLRVDGGPTASAYLMQFQSDITGITVQVPDLQELSGMGAAYVAGIAAGLYDPERIFLQRNRRDYRPEMAETRREELLLGWKEAVGRTLWRPA